VTKCDRGGVSFAMRDVTRVKFYNDVKCLNVRN